jgi:hypothetical protein
MVKAYTEVYRQLLYYVFRSKDMEPGKQPVYKLTGK